MTPPKNTYTVTLADQHSDTVQQSGVPANTHEDAVLNVLQTAPTNWLKLNDGDTLTITVTQP